MVEYNEYDVFYDYEVLENVTTNAMLFPGRKQIVIPYNVNIDTIQPNTPKIEVTAKDEAAILQYIIDENKSSLDRWEIPTDRVRLTSNFMQEILKMDSIIPQNKGTMFGFNSSGYDVAITAYLLDDARQQIQSNIPADELIVDAAMVRQFSDDIINHHARSPWTSVRDIGNQSGNYELFQKFASLMNNPWNIDVQSLNAKMSKTALKRLAAQGGFKIETSDKLGDDDSVLETIEDFAELLAYNVNDIFATMWLFEQKAYQVPFKQRVTLIERYGDNQFQGRDIKRDSTEAKLIENVISPNDALEDDRVVSIAYPVTRDYMPDSKKPTEFSLEDANKLHKALDKATKTLLPESYADNKDKAMNEFLFNQYQEKKEDEPEHIIVKHFFYETGHPLIVSVKGKFVYANDTYEGFNHYMTTMLDYWAQAHQINHRRVKTLTQDKNNGMVKDDDWDDYANAIITHIGDHKENPLYEWFYYEDGKRNVVAKDKSLMKDLLEYMEHKYDMDPDIYKYYSAYRGFDMHQQTSKADVKELLPRRLKTGAAVLVQPGVPVFVTMSIGGVHGNLIDLYSYETDLNVAKTYNRGRDTVKEFYKEKAKQFDADKYIELTGESTKAELEKIHAIVGYDVDELAPVLARRTKRNGFVLGEPEYIQELVPFDYTTGSYSKAKFRTPKRTRPMKSYTTTLYDTDVVHMDISSYYPTLISILGTLTTNDGTDLYNDLREERIALKYKIPDDPATWTEEDIQDDLTQDANKLLLNAASGAADASYDNNIRVNNKAYRMRIAGQLILFALALDIIPKGGVPNSINTDGIYVHNIDVPTADDVIQEWASLYALEADTEVVDLFISKDSNNRIEYYKSDRGETINASGGTVGNWRGTTLTGNLSKPPIVDRALTDYLIRYDEPLLGFDREYIKKYIENFIEERIEKGQNDPAAHEELFNFFMLPIVSNKSKNRYIITQDEEGNWKYPGPINRTFLTVKDTEGNYPTHKAIMIVINKTRKADDPKAVEMAYESDIVKFSDYEDDKDVHITTTKINGIETDQTLVIQNQSTATIDWKLTEYFDIDTYVDMVEAQWENWAV